MTKGPASDHGTIHSDAAHHIGGQSGHRPFFGGTVPKTRILQVLVLALQIFDQVGVSDINRKCAGQIEGAGTASSQHFQGGGLAVDFYRLNGQSLTGADGNSLRLISAPDPVMPDLARAGQIQCRAEAGTTIGTSHFAQFDDLQPPPHRRRIQRRHPHRELTPCRLPTRAKELPNDISDPPCKAHFAGARSGSKQATAMPAEDQRARSVTTPQTNAQSRASTARGSRTNRDSWQS
jgi:hypothetical protein